MFFFFCPHTKWLVSFENMNYLVKPKNYFCQADSVGRSYCSPIISAWQQGCGSCGGPPGTEGAGGRSGGGATIPPPCPLSHYSTTLPTITLFHHLAHYHTIPPCPPFHPLSTITLFHHLAHYHTIPPCPKFHHLVNHHTIPPTCQRCKKRWTWWPSLYYFFPQL